MNFPHPQELFPVFSNRVSSQRKHKAKTTIVLCAISMFLIPSFTLAQLKTTTSVPDTAATLKGVKIKESSFDPQTRVARLVIVNDYAVNITAWGYCVKVTPVDPRSLERSFCQWSDPLGWVIDDRIENAKRHVEAGVADCPWCHFIRPGETYTLVEDYSLDSGVMAAKLILNFVVYADGNAEVLHDPILNATISGQGPLESISAGRKAMLKHKQDLLKLAKEIFSDAGNAHPAATMTDRLKQVAGTDSTMQAELRGFKKPEWRHGNEAEFIPADEREYMRRFVADQEIWVTELAKNQVKGGQQ